MKYKIAKMIDGKYELLEDGECEFGYQIAERMAALSKGERIDKVEIAHEPRLLHSWHTDNAQLYSLDTLRQYQVVSKERLEEFARTVSEFASCFGPVWETAVNDFVERMQAAAQQVTVKHATPIFPANVDYVQIAPDLEVATQNGRQLAEKPVNPQIGDYWYNPELEMLVEWDGRQWLEVLESDE